MLLEKKMDPRVKRTRALLQQALMKLIKEKPFDRITVQDIANRAELNRATFYAHFEDKHGLLNDTLREAFREQIAQQLTHRNELTVANLRGLIEVTCRFLGDFFGHCAPMRTANEQALMFLQVQICIQDKLVQWCAAANQPSSPDSLDAITMTTSWAIWGSVFQWARTGRKIPVPQLTDQILTLIVPGLHHYLLEDDRVGQMGKPQAIEWVAQGV